MLKALFPLQASLFFRGKYDWFSLKEGFLQTMCEKQSFPVKYQFLNPITSTLMSQLLPVPLSPSHSSFWFIITENPLDLTSSQFSETRTQGKGEMHVLSRKLWFWIILIFYAQSRCSINFNWMKQISKSCNRIVLIRTFTCSSKIIEIRLDLSTKRGQSFLVLFAIIFWWNNSFFL